MPMIDLYAPEGLFPPQSERQLGEKLTLAILRAEGVASPTPFHLANTAAFLHLMPSDCVQTAASANAHAVRVQVIAPPSALSRDGQKQLVKEITEIIVETSGDPALASSTWVILTEGAERAGVLPARRSAKRNSLRWRDALKAPDLTAGTFAISTSGHKAWRAFEPEPRPLFC